MPRARWRDWFLGSIGVGKPVKPMAEPMTKPVEGQIGITGQNRYAPMSAQFSSDGRMLAFRLDEIRIEDLDRVRQDPVVRSSLRLLKLPILRAKWQVYSEDPKIEALVQEILRPHMRQLLWALCTAFDYGVAFVEKVWRREPVLRVSHTRSTQDASDVYTYRDVWTIDRVVHLDPSLCWALVYPTGEFAGVRQLQAGDIIPEGKLIHYAVDAEFNEVYGNPVTKPCIPYFEVKVRLLEDLSRYFATYGVPIKKGYAPPGQTSVGTAENGQPVLVDNLEYLAEQLDNLTNAHTIVLPNMVDSAGQRMWEVELAPPPGAAPYEAFLNFLDEQMRQAMGVPALASIHPQMGSYALGRSQIDLFIQNEEAWLQQIQEVLNRQLIPDIVRFNFGSRARPTRIEMTIERDDTAALVDAMISLLAHGQPLQTATGDTLYADWQQLAQEYNLPVLTLTREEMMQQQMEMQQMQAQMMPQMGGNAPSGMMGSPAAMGGNAPSGMMASPAAMGGNAPSGMTGSPQSGSAGEIATPLPVREPSDGQSASPLEPEPTQPEQATAPEPEQNQPEPEPQSEPEPGAPRLLLPRVRINNPNRQQPSTTDG